MSALPNDEYATATVGAEVPPRRGRWADAAPTRSLDHDFHRAPPQMVEVRCECGHSNCAGEIAMSLEEYEAVRLHPKRFLIKEGHEVSDVVRVVDYGTGYVVVAKFERERSRTGASMREISATGYSLALRPLAARLLGLGERGDRLQADLDSRIVERAKDSVSARLGTTPDVAFELLAGLARSQGREIEEYAAAVVAKSGLLDA